MHTTPTIEPPHREIVAGSGYVSVSERASESFEGLVDIALVSRMVEEVERVGGVSGSCLGPVMQMWICRE